MDRLSGDRQEMIKKCVCSKEALTKQSPPNQDTNNVTASQDAQPTDGTAGGQEKE